MRKVEIARLIAFEIGHQWFSNAISPSQWYHFWLHDGFAALYAEETVSKIFNNSQLMDLFIVRNQYEALHLGSHFDINPPYIKNQSEINSIFEFPHYMKGLIVLRMLQDVMTEETFRKAVLTYMYKHLYSSVSVYEFCESFEHQDNLQLEFLLSWMTHSHYPVLKWIPVTTHSGTLTQTSQTSSKWWIYTNVFVQDTFAYTGGYKVYLTPRNFSSHIRFNPGDWIIVDIQQAGYYRTNYESENWLKIARYLNSAGYKNKNFEEYQNRSVINRAKIIDDAFHLVVDGQMNASIFWELSKYLSQETDYLAWYPMIKMFEDMSSIFPYSQNDIYISAIKEKLRQLLNVPLKILGFEERLTEDDLTKCLRQEIVKWACTLEHSECLTAAYHKLQRILEKPENYKILPGWKEWIYCKGLMKINYNVFYKVWDLYVRERDHKLLLYLTCSRFHVIIDKFYTLSDQFKQNEFGNITIILSHIDFFHSIIVKHSNTNFMIENILLSFERLVPKEIKRMTALVDIINHVYSPRLLDMILNYVNAHTFSVKERFLIVNKVSNRILEIQQQIHQFRVFSNT